MSLYRVGTIGGEYERGEKCEHKADGRWIVVKGDAVYNLPHSNNMAANQYAENHGDKNLKWFCAACNNIQEP